MNWKLCPNCKRAVALDENECPYCSQHIPENFGSIKQEDDRPVLIKAFESRRQKHKGFKKFQTSLSPHKESLNNTCPSCNKTFDADAVFCKFCGAQLQGKTRFIPKKVKEEVLARDNWQCVICGKKEDLQFDHIIPYSKGGSNTVENLQILCASCNRKKYTNI